MTIWKFEVIPHHPILMLPIGAEILCAHEQHGQICIWAQIDPTQKTKESRAFEIFGTGEPIPASGSKYRRYIGTAFFQGGNFVFHVFERLKAGGVV